MRLYNDRHFIISRAYSKERRFHMNVRDHVRSYITENILFGDSEHLKDEESLSGSGYIDSTGVIELVAFLEKSFNLRIEDDEIIPENLDTVARIAHYIDLKKAGVEVPKLRFSIA
jgi:acyl carrier protein